MKDFQTVTAAAADRIGGFFAGLRTRITERTDEGDGARIARILRRFFAASVEHHVRVERGGRAPRDTVLPQKHRL